jgi:EmrB/QacA subfamily drug resistance transporter
VTTPTTPPERTAAAGAADTGSRVVPLVDLHGRSAWSILPPLILGFFMIMVDTTIVNIAVPTLQRELDASLVAVGWVNSAYLLSYAVLLLLAGRLGDRYGPKPVFVVGLAVFTLASAWCGLSGSIGMLIAARVVQGVGAALMTPQTMAMITRVFPPRQRGAAMGLWGATAGVATIAGPLLGGVFVESWGWEWIFFVNVPVGVVALWLALTRLPRLATNKRSFDVLGVVLSVVGLFAVVFGLQEGETYDWGTIVGPITVWGVIVVGLLVLAGFVVWQHHLGDGALLPLRLFHSRNFSLANVAGMSVSFAMIGIFFPLTIFLQSILGLSPLHAALVNLPGSLVSGIVAPLAGRLSDRVPAKWVVATGFGTLAVAIGWLAAVVGPGVSVVTIVLPMTLFGIGTGCVFSPLANLATSGLDQRTAGAGAGAFNTTRQVGGVIGSAAIIATLTARLSVELPAAARDAAASLPEQFRQQFVDGFAQAGGALQGGQEGGFQVPPGVPDDVARQVSDAATTAFHQGFAAAVGQTLAVTAAVLVVGFVSAVVMSSRHVEH